MCLYPKLIMNKKYIPNKKNGGQPPDIKDNRVLYVPVGCGKCIECMKQKKRNWQVRMLEDIKVHKNGKFVTLTFSEEHKSKLMKEIKYCEDNYLLNNEIARLAVRRFLERWRKKYKKSVRHFLITELGHTGTERIHLHGIIYTDEKKETIEKIWTYGMVWVGTFVNERTINYIIKYISKLDFEHKNYVPKIFCTAGIGSNYTNSYNSTRNKFNDTNTKEYYINRQGYKIALPTYYRNKIYNDEEREKLWLNKLDKNERWVCGEVVNVEESDEEYIKLREHYREKNKRLGYGDDRVNWDEKQYKNMQKKLKLKENIFK